MIFRNIQSSCRPQKILHKVSNPRKISEISWQLMHSMTNKWRKFYESHTFVCAKKKKRWNKKNYIIRIDIGAKTPWKEEEEVEWIF